MDIQVTPVPVEDKLIIRHLFELYRYDFSEFDGRDVDQHGLYGYGYLDHYWVEENRFPFLIRVNGNIAGFALVSCISANQGPENRMSEFFVVRKYRRQGVGERAAVTLFDRFPGRWVVSQLEANAAAQAFWRRVVAQYTAGRYDEQHLPEHQRVVHTFVVGV